MYNTGHPTGQTINRMKTIMAVEKLKYLLPEPIVRIHSRVIELHPEETEAVITYNEKLNSGQRNGIRLKESLCENREYKCLDCGYTWREDIHAPLILSQSDIQKYYPQAKKCTLTE